MGRTGKIRLSNFEMAHSRHREGQVHDVPDAGPGCTYCVFGQRFQGVNLISLMTVVFPIDVIGAEWAST
jgi:hypothetical protein